MQAREAAQQGAAHVARAEIALRDVQLAQATDAVDRLGGVLQRELGQARERLQAAAAVADPAVVDRLEQAGRQLAEYGRSVGEQARFRRELIVQRDTGFFPASANTTRPSRRSRAWSRSTCPRRSGRRRGSAC